MTQQIRETDVLTVQEIIDFIKQNPGCIVEMFPEGEQYQIDETLLCAPEFWEKVDYDVGVDYYENHHPSLRHEGIAAMRDEYTPPGEVSFEGCG